MSGNEKSKPLSNRVENYLRVSTSGYEVKELGDSSTNALMNELREAERQLAQAQQRIQRLKDMLADSNP